MTDRACRFGTERIASVLPELEADFIVNVQEDEPLIKAELLDQIVKG